MGVDFNKAVCTRDGRRVKILSTCHRSLEDNSQYAYPIRAEVQHPCDPNRMITWCFMSNGQWKSNDPGNHNDLINEMIWHQWLRDVRYSRTVSGRRHGGRSE